MHWHIGDLNRSCKDNLDVYQIRPSSARGHLPAPPGRVLNVGRHLKKSSFRRLTSTNKSRPSFEAYALMTSLLVKLKDLKVSCILVISFLQYLH